MLGTYYWKYLGKYIVIVKDSFFLCVCLLLSLHVLPMEVQQFVVNRL